MEYANYPSTEAKVLKGYFSAKEYFFKAFYEQISEYKHNKIKGC